VTSDSTTRWPLLAERAPFATAVQGDPGRRLPRSVWLVFGLAFLCGGLVSAAGFSIGWRHQAQRNTAAQSALAAANARTHRLELEIGTLRTSVATGRSTAARAQAALAAAAATDRARARTAAKIGDEATTSSGDAASISSGAGSLTAAAARIASELETLDTYLTTTPSGGLDPGYVSTQVAYLARQLTHFRGGSADLADAVASLEAALRTLSRDARALNSG
jgi:hypothetical protein